jgi:prepilin-type N-terminal cleavage/methylation domain-containing protein
MANSQLTTHNSQQKRGLSRSVFLTFLRSKNQAKPWQKSTAGFTLVEVMIAFTIFGILAGVITGALLTVFRSHLFIFNTLNSQANLRFLLETMTREIKEGRGLGFDADTNTLSFTNKDGQQVGYYLENSMVLRAENSEILPITSQDLIVEKFDVAGCLQNPSCQPSVTLLFKVRPRTNPQNSSFYLQTTITQRRTGV